MVYNVHNIFIKTLFIWATFYHLVYANYLQNHSYVKCPNMCFCLGRIVDCSQRNLDDIPNYLPDWTEHLDLSTNQLGYVNSTPLQQLTSLTRLELNKNSLTALPTLEGLLQLRHLSVTFNEITKINKDALNVLPELQILDLTGNRITYIDSNAFPERNILSILILNNNRISGMDVKCFENLTQLTELKLNRNRISQLPKYLFNFKKPSKLKLLEINKNQLEAIDGLTFNSLEHLTVLKLKRNRISYLMDGAFYGLNNIGVLELDGNSIPKVSKRWLFGLKLLNTLSLGGNYIHTIEQDAWDSSPHLKELDLSNNHLEEIDRNTFKKLLHLDRLNLNGNQISVIADSAFNNTPRLQYLDMSNNKISSTIEDMLGAFAGLKRLLRLSLTSNEIKSINRRAFLGLVNLTSLDLSGNNIIGIQENAFDTMPVLQNLVMNTSSLLCDCNLQWFSQWLRKSKFLSIEALCAYPEHLHGKSLIQLSDANFTCGDSPKPYLIEGPETKMTLKGENVSLRCRAKSSSPSVMTFKWKRDNVEIDAQPPTTGVQTQTDNGRSTEAMSELHLYNVTHNDVGKYQCIVENGFGTTYSAKAHITVSIYPSFTKIPKNISVSAGDTAKLECRAHGQPTPSIAWQKDGGHDFPAARERRMHVMPTDDEFFIINAKHDDTGIYTCIANNSAGIIVANATLTVLERPSFSKPMENKDVMVGGTIVLQCMAGGMPRPTVTWSKDGGPLANTERHFFTAEDQLLVIVNTRLTDAGKYECKLSNGLGTVRGYTQLMVVPAPVTVLREGDMMGVIIITVVCCAVGTSIVWVVIIYQTRKRISLSALAVQQSALEGGSTLGPTITTTELGGSIVPPTVLSTHTVTCVYTADNLSEHSSCKDSGMGDSAKRSSDDFLPVDDYVEHQSPALSYNDDSGHHHQTTGVSSEEPLLQQKTRPTNHERLDTNVDESHLQGESPVDD
ncbi:leucine-rich repeats and immunoglobulin-like domains protein 3 [Chrysoperla carnea]|uniref:leucine-rich repeats and immunoglobulin-like domains protein 3 n=1 Tax=Chrysoperla carnea TaxID=189513 RepID=UPI001D06C687|nr:leucine-rich repeats and immunoglobulin-like domains protein 3 [Chrysoperla carnea]